MWQDRDDWINAYFERPRFVEDDEQVKSGAAVGLSGMSNTSIYQFLSIKSNYLENMVAHYKVSWKRGNGQCVIWRRLRNVPV
jgi:hypothetical protein